MLFFWRQEPAARGCRNSNGPDKEGGQGRAEREIGWRPWWNQLSLCQWQ